MADNRLQYIFDLVNGKNKVTPELAKVDKQTSNTAKKYQAQVQHLQALVNLQKKLQKKRVALVKTYRQNLKVSD